MNSPKSINPLNWLMSAPRIRGSVGEGGKGGLDARERRIKFIKPEGLPASAARGRSVPNRDSRIEGMGLGPMAVLPNRQRQGIGSGLVRKGLEILRGRGCPFVIVIGHPDYYPRFGFEPASNYAIKSQWEGIPDQAFMILVFDRKIVSDISGVARYRHEFNDAT